MPVLKWNAFLSLFVEIFRDRPVPHEHPDHEKCDQQGVFDESRLDLAFLMSTFKNGWFLNFRNFAIFSSAKASPTWNSTRMWGSWWSGPTFLGLFAQVKIGNLKVPAEYLNFDFPGADLKERRQMPVEEVPKFVDSLRSAFSDVSVFTFICSQLPLS